MPHYKSAAEKGPVLIDRAFLLCALYVQTELFDACTLPPYPPESVVLWPLGTGKRHPLPPTPRRICGSVELGAGTAPRFSPAQGSTQFHSSGIKMHKETAHKLWRLPQITQIYITYKTVEHRINRATTPIWNSGNSPHQRSTVQEGLLLVTSNFARTCRAAGQAHADRCIEEKDRGNS